MDNQLDQDVIDAIVLLIDRGWFPPEVLYYAYKGRDSWDENVKSKMRFDECDRTSTPEIVSDEEIQELLSQTWMISN